MMKLQFIIAMSLLVVSNNSYSMWLLGLGGSSKQEVVELTDSLLNGERDRFMTTINPQERPEEGWNIVGKDSEEKDEEKIGTYSSDGKTYILIHDYTGQKEKRYALAAMWKGAKVANPPKLRFEFSTKVTTIKSAGAITDDISKESDTFFSIDFGKGQRKGKAVLTPFSIIFLYPNLIERYAFKERMEAVNKATLFYLACCGAGKNKLAFFSDRYNGYSFVLNNETRQADLKLKAALSAINAISLIIKKDENKMVGAVWASGEDEQSRQVLIWKWSGESDDKIIKNLQLDEHGKEQIENALNYS